MVMPGFNTRVANALLFSYNEIMYSMQSSTRLCDIFRIFCFFEQGQLIILTNGFQKKTQKTLKKEIEKTLKIKQDYEKEK